MTVKTPNNDLLFASISRRWPNAVKYITKMGILKAFHEGNHYITLDTWEFEAKECERVLKAIDYKEGPVKCPNCGGRRFQTNILTIVDFSFPFVDGRRVQVRGFQIGDMLQKTDVKCLQCGKSYKQKEAA